MDFLVWRRKNKSLGHTQRECPRHNIKGFYVGGEKVDTYVITDLDLHIIAEGGEWVHVQPIQIYGRYAQVGGYYIEECNGQEQHRPKRLDGGRYVDLKTKKSLRLGPGGIWRGTMQCITGWLSWGVR